MASQPLTTSAYVEPVAMWRVTLDGQDITSLFNPRLISLRISMARQEKADQLEITLDDSDNLLAIPPSNATLAVSLGWLQGTGVVVGLVPMGTFVVDDVTWEGPPDVMRIKAHSADLKDSYRTRKTRTWTGQTLAAITGQIAAEQGLTNRCHPDLADTTVAMAEQSNQSDMEFLRDLGRRYDAVATVKGGALILAPIDATTTATGANLPALAITRQSGDRYSFSRSARDGTYQGAEANHYDQDAAGRALHQEGATPRRRLKRVYGNQADAQAATRAETQRLQRAGAKFDLTLSYGNAQIAPGMTATAQGFKSDIDATPWRTTDVEHEMGANGFSTSLTLEVAG